MTAPHTKVCRRCNLTKLVGQFGVDRAKPDRLTTFCLACKSDLNHAYYEQHREYFSARNRAAREAAKQGEHRSVRGRSKPTTRGGKTLEQFRRELRERLTHTENAEVSK